MKLVGPNFSKNQKYRIFYQKKQPKRLESIFKPEKGKLGAKCLLACSPDTDNKIFHNELTENCFAILDQSSCTIFLMWYYQLYFFPWISCGYPIDGSLRIFDKTIRGEHIIQFCSIFVSSGSMYFFISKLKC